MNSRTWWSRRAEVGAWGISALAWGLSYTSQYVLARDDGYGALAVVWPLTVDLASLVAMLLALDMARRSLNALQAWPIAFGSALVMIGANVLMAWPDAIRWLCTLAARHRLGLLAPARPRKRSGERWQDRSRTRP